MNSAVLARKTGPTLARCAQLLLRGFEEPRWPIDVGPDLILQCPDSLIQIWVENKVENGPECRLDLGRFGAARADRPACDRLRCYLDLRVLLRAPLKHGAKRSKPLVEQVPLVHVY